MTGKGSVILSDEFCILRVCLSMGYAGWWWDCFNIFYLGE